MQFCCVADFHGLLPDNLPSADTLIIAGDLCPIYDHGLGFQRAWLLNEFTDWLRFQLNNKFKHIVFIAGNHDLVFVSTLKHDLLDIWQKIPNLHYLENEECVINNIHIYGSPYQNYCGQWAFSLYEYELRHIYDKIPDNIDIIVSHGPPKYHGDRINHGWSQFTTNDDLLDLDDDCYTGSVSLLENIRRIQPSYVVCGHIHEGYGQYEYKFDNLITKIINCSILDECYKLKNEPILFEFNK